MSRYAVDCSSFTGLLTTAQAQAIKDMGFSKAIVNLYGGATAQSQIDAFQSVGMEVDGYIYFYFSQTAEYRISSQLANLAGRTVNFLWLDWEDDPGGKSQAEVVDFINNAVAYCSGKIYTGMYTRRQWWVDYTGDSHQFEGMWIWDATNDGTPDMSYKPYGGFKHYMEQYRFDVVLVPGVGNFDLNVYEDPEPPLPVPTPSPEPEPSPTPPPLDLLAEALRLMGGGDKLYAQAHVYLEALQQGK